MLKRRRVYRYRANPLHTELSGATRREITDFPPALGTITSSYIVEHGRSQRRLPSYAITRILVPFRSRHRHRQPQKLYLIVESSCSAHPRDISCLRYNNNITRFIKLGGYFYSFKSQPKHEHCIYDSFT